MLNEITEYKRYPHRNYSHWTVTIGSFDGLHLGHRHLISQMQKHAAKNSSGVRIITFDPHPKEILGNSPMTKIYDSKIKIELCHSLGVDSVVVIPFTKAFSKVEPEQFISNYLLKDDNVSKVYLGSNFLFGKNRAGSIDTIKNIFSKIGLSIEEIGMHRQNNTVVSSSIIRTLLLNGEFNEAGKLLGRPWEVTGIVQHGKQLGGKLGFPTLNIIPTVKLPVIMGVYATLTNIAGKYYRSVTNIGIKPTLQQSNEVTIETHIFNFDQTLYDERVSVLPVKFIRNEKKFCGIQELTDQIGKDKKEAEDILRNTNYDSAEGN